MQFDVLTLFPEMFEPLKQSILGKAQEKNIIDINITNIRDFSKDKHKKVDDTPYGGGAGMVIKPDVVYDAYQSIKNRKHAKVIYLSPKGKTLNQEKVVSLSKEEHLILLCGHYEGIDQRVLDEIVDEEISIGDYVLTGGELPCMVLIDSVSRYVNGVLTEDSVKEESFSNGMLEYPQYTRPEIFLGKKVPEVLTSRSSWKYKQMAKRTIRSDDKREKTRSFGFERRYLKNIEKRKENIIMDIIKSIEHEQLKNKIPDLHVGDTIRVHQRIKEGNRERIQVFEGIVIKKQGGSVNATFTVRRVAYGVGVEKTFLINSPMVEKVEVVRVGKARRAKLYYLRDRVGKAAKTRENLRARIENKEIILKEDLAENENTEDTKENATQLVETVENVETPVVEETANTETEKNPENLEKDTKTEE